MSLTSEMRFVQFEKAEKYVKLLQLVYLPEKKVNIFPLLNLFFICENFFCDELKQKPFACSLSPKCALEHKLE